VFISSDMSQADANEHYAHQSGGWLALAWDDPLAAALKRRRARDAAPSTCALRGACVSALPPPLPMHTVFARADRVWSGREVETFGFRRRSGVPAVVVIDPSGSEVAFLPGERYGGAFDATELGATDAAARQERRVTRPCVRFVSSAAAALNEWNPTDDEQQRHAWPRLKSEL
jgi:hypothetical protein